MNVNLARPYDTKCSPPQNPLLAFHSPQSETLLFQNEKSITIIAQPGFRGLGLTWTLHRNMIEEPFARGEAEAEPANQFKIEIDTSKLIPGFYDLRVKVDKGEGKPVEGICTFGWKADEMAIADTRPKDFTTFWKDTLRRYESIPLDLRIESEPQIFNKEAIDSYNLQHAALPADYDPQGQKYEEVESYKISYAGPDGGRVYGWLAKPRGPGPFPAMLVLPGAGFAARPRPLEQARHGYVALDIQIHGQDVDLEKYEKLPGYYDQWIFQPPRDFYFQNVYLRATRAVEILTSLPEVKKDELVVVGGSQGGRLGLVVAALDQRVQAVVSCIANSPNDPHRRWVAECNGKNGTPENPAPKSNGMSLTGPPPFVKDEAGTCWAYYDPMNFAPDIRCPVLMNAGLIDPVSPPYSIWAAFLRIGTPDKKMVPLPGLAHDWSPEFDRQAWRWLADRLTTSHVSP